MENSGYAIKAETEEDFKDIEYFMFHDEVKNFIFRNPDNAQKNVHELRDKSFQCYILHDKMNKKIGFGIIKIFDAINKACVDVGAPKEGRGKCLIEAAQDALKQVKKEHPSLEIFSYVSKRNKRALHFNWRCGFKIHKSVFGNKIMRHENVQ